MRVVFFGTPDYVLPILNSLHKEFKGRSGKSSIVAVVTQKPSPAGRRQKLAYSPVDTWAHKRNVPVYYDSTDLIKKQARADLGVLESYGEIIPGAVIKHFPSGILNAHPSLLPKFRGASPVQATIVTGDKITGVTTIKLDERLDHGPIVSQFKEEVLATDTTDSLRRRLFERSAEVLCALIPPYLQGKIAPRKQDDTKATFTTRIKKAHGFIPPKYLSNTFKGLPFKGKWEIPFIKDYSLNPTLYTLERFIRAMQPWPVAWTYVQLGKGHKVKGKRLKILEAHLEPSQTTNYKPQTTKLVLDEIQLEGKNPVSWKQFKEAYPTALFKK